VQIKFHSALIMGSSRGLGRAIAIKLAQEGVGKIAIHYHSRKDEAEKTLALVRGAGSDGVLVRGDTSDAGSVRTIVEEAAAQLGGCDIFVQSAVPAFDKIMNMVWQPKCHWKNGNSASTPKRGLSLLLRRWPPGTCTRAAES
jgi:NAD(P)-dependent dehydrogenase (short-subunit alcohol dehydrogenase family)